MTLPPPSAAAISIASLVGARGGAELFAVESSGSRRKEAPLSTVTRREIKSYKYESDKYERNMQMEAVRGNTSGITRSRSNERHMNASKAAKATKQKAAKSQLKAAKGVIQGGA